MGSGLGNKPSHGGNGYKIGSMVATVLSRLGLEARPRESRLRAGGAGAKRLRKSKRSVDEGRPVYESKKRVTARPYDGTGKGGMEGARGRTELRWKEMKRKKEGDTVRKGERRREGSRNTGSHPTGI